jgi:hypothetical protein
VSAKGTKAAAGNLRQLSAGSEQNFNAKFGKAIEVPAGTDGRTPKRNRLGTFNQPSIICHCCGKRTTENAGEGTELCRVCFESAGMENQHSDSNGEHYGNGPQADCPYCLGLGCMHEAKAVKPKAAILTVKEHEAAVDEKAAEALKPTAKVKVKVTKVPAAEAARLLAGHKAEPVGVPEKVCATCKTSKPLDLFASDVSSGAKGQFRYGSCKACGVIARARQKANRAAKATLITAVIADPKPLNDAITDLVADISKSAKKMAKKAK